MVDFSEHVCIFYRGQLVFPQGENYACFSVIHARFLILQLQLPLFVRNKPEKYKLALAFMLVWTGSFMFIFSYDAINSSTIFHVSCMVMILSSIIRKCPFPHVPTCILSCKMSWKECMVKDGYLVYSQVSWQAEKGGISPSDCQQKVNGNE